MEGDDDVKSKAEMTKKRILLVDDDPDILELLSRRIRSWGHEVITAANGEDCLRKTEEEPTDLIVLDIVLPAMRGRDVCALLKANPKTSHIPVVFLSALAMPEHIEAGFRCGAEGYIVKPFNAGDVRNQIEHCLNK